MRTLEQILETARSLYAETFELAIHGNDSKSQSLQARCTQLLEETKNIQKSYDTDEAIAHIHHCLGFVENRFERYDKAHDHYKIAIAIKAALLTLRDSFEFQISYALTLNNCAFNLQDSQKISEAEGFYLKAISQIKSLEKKHVTEKERFEIIKYLAIYYANLAWYYQNSLEQTGDALHYYELSIAAGKNAIELSDNNSKRRIFKRNVRRWLEYIALLDFDNAILNAKELLDFLSSLQFGTDIKLLKDIQYFSALAYNNLSCLIVDGVKASPANSTLYTRLDAHQYKIKSIAIIETWPEIEVRKMLKTAIYVNYFDNYAALSSEGDALHTSYQALYTNFIENPKMQFTTKDLFIVASLASKLEADETKADSASQRAKNLFFAKSETVLCAIMYSTLKGDFEIRLVSAIRLHLTIKEQCTLMQVCKPKPSGMNKS